MGNVDRQAINKFLTQPPVTLGLCVCIGDWTCLCPYPCLVCDMLSYFSLVMWIFFYRTVQCGFVEVFDCLSVTSIANAIPWPFSMGGIFL